MDAFSLEGDGNFKASAKCGITGMMNLSLHPELLWEM